MLTHGNIVSNLLQSSAWWGSGMKEGEEIIITALPLYHIFALTGNCLVFMKIGAKNAPAHELRELVRWADEHSPVGCTIRQSPETVVEIEVV